MQAEHVSGMSDLDAHEPGEEATLDYSDADEFQIEAQGHRLSFYPRGSDRLKALLEHIAAAKSSLLVFYYMFQDDVSGAKVRDALCDAAERGVRVHLVVDAFGSDAKPEFFDPLLLAGGTFMVFSARWGARYFLRNHQKFVIVDAERVFTGGANVSDDYFKAPRDNGWCDLSVSIEGPVVRLFVRWFALLRAWVKRGGNELLLLRRMVTNWDPGHGPVRLLVGGPLVRRGNWVWQFKKDLTSAGSLNTVSAYFSPTRSVLRLIANVSTRGKVRLITAGKSDIDATIDIARLHYKKMLRAGVEVHEFQPCKLHMKLLIVDDVCYFGSANLDKRSLRINVELMVRIDDAALAQRMREFIDHLQTGSALITPQWYAKQATWSNRMRRRLLHWFAKSDYRISRWLNR